MKCSTSYEVFAQFCWLNKIISFSARKAREHRCPHLFLKFSCTVINFDGVFGTNFDGKKSESAHFFVLRRRLQRPAPRIAAS